MNNKRALINNLNKKDIPLETAQHSFSYDTIFEENQLGLKLVATKGEAEILVDWISNTSEHYGTIVEDDVLVAIGGTAVPTLQNYRRRLKRVKQLIAKSPRPLLITFSRQLSRETVVTPPSDHVQDDDDNDDKDKDKRHESDDDTTATTTTNSTTTTITTTTITTTRTMTNAPITTSTDIVNPSFIRNVTRLPLLSLAPAPVPTPAHDG